MSTPNTTQMTCPKCSTTFDIEQYSVINAQTQPELREKLLNGSMFLQTCPRCGTHMHAAYTCVYSNDEKKFLVSFQPSMEKPAVTPLMPQYKLRLERTLVGFLERIRILEAELDDVTIEMVKYLVTAQLTRQFPNKTITRLLFVSADNENVFFQYDDNNPAEQIQIPLATIWRYEDRLTASGFRPNVTGYLAVDSQFVRNSGILRCLAPQTPKDSD